MSADARAVGQVGDAGNARAVLVFAAALLSDALDEVERAYGAPAGVEVKAWFAASSLLAKQIEAGAPAGLFLSADRESMDSGRYARAAPSQLGVWPQVSARLVRAENVRVTLEYVAHEVFRRYGFEPLARAP